MPFGLRAGLEAAVGKVGSPPAPGLEPAPSAEESMRAAPEGSSTPTDDAAPEIPAQAPEPDLPANKVTGGVEPPSGAVKGLEIPRQNAGVSLRTAGPGKLKLPSTARGNLEEDLVAWKESGRVYSTNFSWIDTSYVQTFAHVFTEVYTKVLDQLEDGGVQLVSFPLRGKVFSYFVRLDQAKKRPFEAAMQVARMVCVHLIYHYEGSTDLGLNRLFPNTRGGAFRIGAHNSSMLGMAVAEEAIRVNPQKPQEPSGDDVLRQVLRQAGRIYLAQELPENSVQFQQSLNEHEAFDSKIPPRVSGTERPDPNVPYNQARTQVKKLAQEMMNDQLIDRKALQSKFLETLISAAKGLNEEIGRMVEKGTWTRNEVPEATVSQVNSLLRHGWAYVGPDLDTLRALTFKHGAQRLGQGVADLPGALVIKLYEVLRVFPQESSPVDDAPEETNARAPSSVASSQREGLRSFDFQGSYRSDRLGVLSGPAVARTVAMFVGFFNRGRESLGMDEQEATDWAKRNCLRMSNHAPGRDGSQPPEWLRCNVGLALLAIELFLSLAKLTDPSKQSMTHAAVTDFVRKIVNEWATNDGQVPLRPGPPDAVADKNSPNGVDVVSSSMPTTGGEASKFLPKPVQEGKAEIPPGMADYLPSLEETPRHEDEKAAPSVRPKSVRVWQKVMGEIKLRQTARVLERIVRNAAWIVHPGEDLEEVAAKLYRRYETVGKQRKNVFHKLVREVMTMLPEERRPALARALLVRFGEEAEGYFHPKLFSELREHSAPRS